MRLIIGLGGNVGDVRSAFSVAVVALQKSRDVEIQDRSSIYRTDPHGPEQPSYLNAAVMAEVEISPRELLRLCQSIEQKAGRDRSIEARWGPRTLDLDLLIADTLVCRGPGLELPHPRMAERAFALVPAAEIAPYWVHSIEGRSLAELVAAVPKENSGAVFRIGRW